jgi:hypothetical protein
LASIRSGNAIEHVLETNGTCCPATSFTNVGAHVMNGGEPGAFVRGYQDRPCARLSQVVNRLWRKTPRLLTAACGPPTTPAQRLFGVAHGADAHVVPGGGAGRSARVHLPKRRRGRSFRKRTGFPILDDAFYRIASVRIDGTEATVTNESQDDRDLGPPRPATGVVVEGLSRRRWPSTTFRMGWLDSFYPGDTNFDALAVADDDEDGYATWEEFIADTDPTDAGEYFRIATAPAIPPAIAFFTSSTGRLYSLVACHDLLVGAWSNVPGAGPRRGLGGADSLTDTNDPPVGWYYQIQVQVP